MHCSKDWYENQHQENEATDCGIPSSQKTTIILNGDILEEVDRLKYFGSIITTTGQNEEGLVFSTSQALLFIFGNGLVCY